MKFYSVWKKHAGIFDLVFILFFGFAILIMKDDTALIVSFILIFPYIYFTGRKNMIRYLLIATIIALIWSFVAGDYYGYGTDIIVIYGVNFFPFLVWTMSLFGIYVISSHLKYLFKLKRSFSKFILFTLVFWVLLISIEVLAYYLFNMRNIVTASYPGLPICDCIHAPRWMQISYFSLGPIYYVFCILFDKVLNKKKKINKKNR